MTACISPGRTLPLGRVSRPARSGSAPKALSAVFVEVGVQPIDQIRDLRTSAVLARRRKSDLGEVSLTTPGPPPPIPPRGRPPPPPQETVRPLNPPSELLRRTPGSEPGTDRGVGRNRDSVLLTGDRPWFAKTSESAALFATHHSPPRIERHTAPWRTNVNRERETTLDPCIRFQVHRGARAEWSPMRHTRVRHDHLGLQPGGPLLAAQCT